MATRRLDVSYLPMMLQQQLQDLLYFVQTQEQRKTLPRIGSLRLQRIAVGGSFGVVLELMLLKANPEATTATEQRIDIAVRISPRFPLESPMIACIAGGEHLPVHLRRNDQIVVPWLEGGWPEQYTIPLFISDLCVSMDVSLRPRAVYPLEQERLNQQVIRPSAPTLYPDHDETAQADFIMKCKWRNVQKDLKTRKPQKVADMYHVLRCLFPMITDAEVTITEFHSSNSGVLVKSDEDVHRLSSSGLSSIFLLIQDVQPKSNNVSVDLLGINAPEKRYHAVAVSSAKSTPPPDSIKNIFTAGNSIRQLLWSDFEVTKSVGVGSSCCVYLANWRGADIAVKTFTGSERTAVEREFANEVTMMTTLGSHPSLVLFLGICAKPLSIIFEYLPFSLFELINGVDDPKRQIPPFPMSWTRRVSMMLDIAKGLQFLHSFNIVHRDLKSLNLLVTAEGRVKLADFGISRIAKQSDKMMTGCVGTFQWMAPEVIVSENYSISADIYSLGIIMWEICERAPPFANVPPGLVPITVVQEKKRPALSASTPQALQQLIQRCWQEQPDQRPRAAEVASTLQAFFPKPQ